MSRATIVPLTSFKLLVPRSVSLIKLLTEGEIDRYRVQATDGLRKPFLTRYFDTIDTAHDFYQRLIGEDPLQQCNDCLFAPCACGSQAY